MIRDLNTKPFACKANALPIELIILITHPLDSLHICFADVKLWNYILDYLKDQVTIRRRHYLIITPPRISQRSYDDSDGIFVPYLLREVRRLERPKKSNFINPAFSAEYISNCVEGKRKSLDSKFGQMNKDYVSQFEKRVKDGMEMAQGELSRAIESGDATAQVNAQKRIAALSIDEARLNVMKEQKPAESKPTSLDDAVKLPNETPKDLPDPDPRAEEWAGKNSWFGQDRAMTFTAFEIHKDLVDLSLIHI